MKIIFTCVYLVFPAPFVENFSFFIELLLQLCKKICVDLDLNSLLFSFNIVVNFYSNSILCLLLKLYNKNRINPEIKYCLSSNFVLLQSCFSILSCLHFHINLRIGLSISTKNKACRDID